MDENLADLPLADADEVIRQQIEHHRAEMGAWRQKRAELVAAAHTAGQSVADIASELAVHPDVVYKLLRQARS